MTSEVIRSSFGELTFVELVIKMRNRDGKTYKEKHAKVRCSCGVELTIQFSRWKNTPPASCKKCALKRIKRMGRGVFHHTTPAPKER